MVRQVFQAYSNSYFFFIYILFGKKSNLRDLALMFSILLIKCTDTTDTIIITGLVHVLTLF